jgi:hypothetical protein
MRETDARRKEMLSGKGHIRLPEQMDTGVRYPIWNARADYSNLASITNIPDRRTRLRPDNNSWLLLEIIE